MANSLPSNNRSEWLSVGVAEEGCRQETRHIEGRTGKRRSNIVSSEKFEAEIDKLVREYEEEVRYQMRRKKGSESEVVRNLVQ